MRLVDSHGHLQSDRFDADRDEVIARARDGGVERILVPGWNIWSSEAALELVERVGWLDAAVGVHPHDAAKVPAAEWTTIEGWAADERVVAIGETGLDYDRVFSPIPDQLDNLRRNLELALALGKPAILHCRSAAGQRDAQDALLDELRSAGFGAAGGRATAAFGGRPAALIHSFSGPLDYAREMLALGVAISFSGLVFRTGEEVSAAVAALVPSDRLLVETDAPYLSPPGGPRGRNEPAFVRVTAAWVAECRSTGLVEPYDGEEPDGIDLVAAYDSVFDRSGRT